MINFTLYIIINVDGTKNRLSWYCKCVTLTLAATFLLSINKLFDNWNVTAVLENYIGEISISIVLWRVV